MVRQKKSALTSALVFGVTSLALLERARAEDGIPTPVTWTNADQVNASQGALSRQAGAGWTAGASSSQTITEGDGYVAFSTDEANRHKMAGLSSSDDSRSYVDIDYAFYLRDDGYVMIYEQGASLGFFGTYVAGDHFRIEVSDGTVRYRTKDGVIHESSTAPNYPLGLDTSLYSDGATITEAVVTVCGDNDSACSGIEDWKNVRYTKISPYLQRVPTTGTGWNAGASSIREINETNGFADLRSTETNTHKMAGLGYSDDNQSYTDIDYAFYFRNDGYLSIYESGAAQGIFGTYSDTDIFRVEVINDQVRYRKNGRLIYTSLTPPAYPLALDVSLYNEGATFESLSLYRCDEGEGGPDCAPDDLWKNVRYVEADLAVLTRIPVTGTGWNAGASSVEEITEGNGQIEFTALEANRGKMVGLGNSDDNQSYTDINHAFYLRHDGYMDIYESGAPRGTFGTYQTWDIFNIEVVNGQVRYRHNGAVIHTSFLAPAYPLALDVSFLHEGASIHGLISSCWSEHPDCLPVEAWKNVRYTRATDDGLERASYTGWAWNAGASSVAEITGDGFVEFSTLEANKGKMAGLGSDDDNESYTDIDYAFYLDANGGLSIYESGNPRGSFGTYAAGDVLRVEVLYGQVRYSKNGVALYTSSTPPPARPLALDTSLLHEGATITSFVVQD